MSTKTHHAEHCLNCGKALRGRYCANCGQDSFEHQDSLWHLIQHFFNDITHYDGKLWKTVKPLLVKPGFLTQEYLKGKRVSYLNPVRMFIFLNFILFLFIAWAPHKNSAEGKKPNLNISYNNADLTLTRYDSIQNALPPEKRHSQFERGMMLKIIDGLEKIKQDPQALEHYGETFMHNTAKLTFVFLLVSTCLLGLLYFRKHLPMTDHALFAIHLSCTFLLLSIVMLTLRYLPYSVFLEVAVFLYGVYYFYRALLIVYRQSFLKTSLKFIAISLSLTCVMTVLAVANALYSVITVV